VPDRPDSVHSASLGMAFYDGTDVFRRTIPGDAFAGRAGILESLQGAGREVIRIPIEKGEPRALSGLRPPDSRALELLGADPSECCSSRRLRCCNGRRRSGDLARSATFPPELALRMCGARTHDGAEKVSASRLRSLNQFPWDSFSCGLGLGPTVGPEAVS